MTDLCEINTGVAFGLFTGLNQVYLALFQVLLLFVMVFFLLRVFYILRNSWGLVGAFFVASLGNITDRFFLGGVCDYISIFNLPVFNLNDIFILTSLCLIFLFIFYEETYCSERK